MTALVYTRKSCPSQREREAAEALRGFRPRFRVAGRFSAREMEAADLVLTDSDIVAEAYREAGCEVRRITEDKPKPKRNRKK